MRFKVFTHNDLDAVGCVVVANHAFGKENVDYDLCNYNEINNKVKDFILSPEIEKYSRVFITDISVNEEVAGLIDLVEQTQKGTFQLIDHHSTAEWLNKYHWAFVEEVDWMLSKTSGTSMLYNWLVVNGYYDFHHRMTGFCELVRRYDSWEWSTKYNDEHAKRLNDLLYIIGQTKFIQRFTENIDFTFTEVETLVLDIEEEKIKKYIESKGKDIHRTVIKGKNCGVVYGEQYISQLGNELSKENPDLDMIIIINPSKGMVSYRTIHDHVNVGEFAKLHGGGGHPQSSGSTFDKEITSSWIEDVFKEAQS